MYYLINGKLTSVVEDVGNVVARFREGPKYQLQYSPVADGYIFRGSPNLNAGRPTKGEAIKMAQHLGYTVLIDGIVVPEIW